jgi:hypothetical protein
VAVEGEFFAMSFSTAGADWITRVADTLLGGGPGRSGVTVGAEALEIRMSMFRLVVPRASLVSAARHEGGRRGSSGVHIWRGHAIVNGSSEGLVELRMDPPPRTPRQLSTLWLRQRIRSVVLSLADPGGFLGALE